MADHYVVDRRLNPKGKSLGNRQRFIRKAKKSFSDKLSNRSIKDKNGESVSVPIDGVSEPEFSYDRTSGDSDFVVPGNKDFVVGDAIGKPPSGNGGGDPQQSDDGEGLDEFEFTLSRDEYLDLIFDGLELPNLENKGKDITIESLKRAGYTNQGSPANLNVEQSMIRSLGRRIALKFPKRKQIQELEELLLNETDPIKIEDLNRKIQVLKKRAAAIPFIDPVDLRFNAHKKETTPVTSATMFCVMDVSASMDQFHKELAKRFYILLYLFLEKNYEKINVVFIRHHVEAKECTEEEFFHSKETGGTIVSPSLRLVVDIMNKRFPPSENNIYVCQATDGDNSYSDNPKCEKILKEEILPFVQGYFYVEVHPHGRRISFSDNAPLESDLWGTMYPLESEFDNVICDELFSEKDVVPVFREFFRKR